MAVMAMTTKLTLGPIAYHWSADARRDFYARIADEAREATGPMKATRGRASFLGERSIGHCDPGATSARLLIHAVLDVIEQGDAR